MPPAVVRADVAVVVDPVFVAGVVRRIDVDNANLAAVRGAQQAQRIKIVAFDDEVVEGLTGLIGLLSSARLVVSRRMTAGTTRGSTTWAFSARSRSMLSCSQYSPSF